MYSRICMDYNKLQRRQRFLYAVRGILEARQNRKKVCRVRLTLEEGGNRCNGMMLRVLCGIKLDVGFGMKQNQKNRSNNIVR